MIQLDGTFKLIHRIIAPIINGNQIGHFHRSVLKIDLAWSPWIKHHDSKSEVQLATELILLAIVDFVEFNKK